MGIIRSKQIININDMVRFHYILGTLYSSTNIEILSLVSSYKLIIFMLKKVHGVSLPCPQIFQE